MISAMKTSPKSQTALNYANKYCLLEDGKKPFGGLKK
tara:strand:- start:122 stop:232 length:111 start_codon:yes stop_codon:yes gene_type:complete